MAPFDREPTEPPTPERLRRARARGDVAHSRELTAALGLAGAVAVLWAAAPVGWTRALGLFRRALVGSVAPPADQASLWHRLGAAAGDALSVAAPLILVPSMAVLAVAVLVTLAQTRGLFAWGAVRVDVGRVSPLGGLGRLFAARTVAEMVRGLVKVTLVLAVAGAALLPLARSLAGLTGARPPSILGALGWSVGRVGSWVAVALVALGVLEGLWARRRHMRSLMMTREELAREHKEAEGDPRRNAERARLHREIGEQRSFDHVRKADFVVVNPDHIAVAVRYDRDAEGAPVVVAKGERLAAERIRQTAREAGVPIYRDLGLARALAELPEGQEIPEALYEAVAEILRALWEVEGSAGLATAETVVASAAPEADARTADSPANGAVRMVPPGAVWKRV